MPWFGFNFVKDQKKLLDKYGDVMYPLKEAVKQHPSANAFLVQQGPLVILTLAGPDHIKEFSNSNITSFDRIHNQQFPDPLMKNSLATLTGDDWRLHRKIFADSFRVALFEKNVSDNFETTIEFFQKISLQEMKEFSPRDQLRKIFSTIVGQTFIGEGLDKSMIEGTSAFPYLFEAMSDLAQATKTPLFVLPVPENMKKLLIRPYGRFCARIRKFQKLMLRIIRETRERTESDPNREGRSILEKVLRVQKQYKEVITDLDDEATASEFIGLMHAGIELTTVLLTITLYYLSLYPDLVKELVDEVHEAIPDGKVTSIDQLNSLDLMHSVLKEVLRLHPLCGFTAKEAVRDIRIVDLEIKKGDYVGIAIQAVSSNPEYWEEPEKFNPWRFVKGAAATNQEPFAFLGFSTGMRNCIGQHFAMIEAKSILSAFLTIFDFKPVPGYKLKLAFKGVLEPVDPVKLILTRKLGS